MLGLHQPGDLGDLVSPSQPFDLVSLEDPCWISLLHLGMTQMGMDQYLLIPFLGGWTSIYQLFWGSLGTRVLTHPQMFVIVSSSLVAVQLISDSWDSWDPGIPTWGTKSFPPKKGSVSGDSTLYRWFFHDKATKKNIWGILMDFGGTTILGNFHISLYTSKYIIY